MKAWLRERLCRIEFYDIVISTLYSDGLHDSRTCHPVCA